MRLNNKVRNTSLEAIISDVMLIASYANSIQVVGRFGCALEKFRALDRTFSSLFAGCPRNMKILGFYKKHLIVALISILENMAAFDLPPQVVFWSPVHFFEHASDGLRLDTGGISSPQIQ